MLLFCIATILLAKTITIIIYNKLSLSLIRQKQLETMATRGVTATAIERTSVIEELKLKDS